MKLLTITHRCKGQSRNAFFDGSHGEIAIITEKCSQHRTVGCKCEKGFYGIETGAYSQVATVSDYDMSVEMLAEKIAKYSSMPEGADAKSICTMAIAHRLPLCTEIKRSGPDTAEVMFVPDGITLKFLTDESVVIPADEIQAIIGDVPYTPVKAFKLNIESNPSIALPFALDVGKGAFQRVVKKFNDKGGEF